MKRAICYILLVLLLGVFGYSAWQFFDLREEYTKGEDSYSDLQKYVSVRETEENRTLDQPQNQPTRGEDDFQSASEEKAFVPPISVDFEALREINSDVVGWIYIEGTEINYPIVQGENNDYYLYRLFDRTVNETGCIFMDAKCDSDFSGENNIIYGHYRKDGSMFYDVQNYRDQSYYDEHAEGVLLTPEGAHRIAFFSGYIAKTSDNAWDTAFTEEGYAQWIEGISARSLFEPSRYPAVTDRILTLTTCTYEFTGARFVLHGIVLE